MSGKPINLNQARKARAKVRAKAQAAENAVKFGRTKTQKLQDAAEAARLRAGLDGTKLDKDPD